jgi:hypothetical protein
MQRLLRRESRRFEQHIGVNVADAVAELRACRPGRAAAKLFRRTNVESMPSVLENLYRIRSL